MLNHILVPLDGSPLAEQALPYAQRILAPEGRLTLVCAVDLPDVMPHSFYPMVNASLGSVTVDSTNYGYDPAEFVKMAHSYLDQVITPLRAITGFEFEVFVEVAEPAELIVKTAKALNPDAIVMSTHGRSGLSRWLFGSVTTKVLNATPCPVLVIPSRQLQAKAEAQLSTAELHSG